MPTRDHAKVLDRSRLTETDPGDEWASRLAYHHDPMKENLFLQAEFLLLVAFSVVVPGAIFWYMVARRAISRTAVLALGLVLILVGGVDIALLHLLASKGMTEPNSLGERLFASEISVGLYLLPALFAGIGINLVSHVLVHHLVQAEHRFDQNHPRRRDARPIDETTS